MKNQETQNKQIAKYVRDDCKNDSIDFLRRAVRFFNSRNECLNDDKTVNELLIDFITPEPDDDAELWTGQPPENN